MSLKAKAGDLYRSVKLQWRRPAKGRYIPFKEIANYSIGGMGVQFLQAVVGYVVVSGNIILFGSTFGINSMDLAIMNIVSTILGFGLNALKGMLIDNTRTKAGKFRPYIFFAGIPVAILISLLAFVPTDMNYYLLCVILFLLFVVINFFFSLQLAAYSGLVQVMSPNSRERTAVMSVSSIVYSIAPTLMGVIVPLIANMFPKALADIGTYRVIFPVFSVLGVLFSMIAYFGTKERIIVPQRYVPKVKFADGMAKVAKNKYFWIVNISGMFNTLKMANSVLFGWMMTYAQPSMFGMSSMELMAILSTILGTASLPGMALAPLLINKFGKKKIINISNITYVIANVLLIFVFLAGGNVILFFLLVYLWTFAQAVQIVTGPAVGADVLDYQQYRTGDRLEGFISQTGATIQSLIGLGAGLIMPALYNFFGLKTNYDILYVDDVRNTIFIAVVAVSAAGALGAAIPYFFYDLSEARHRNIIRVLSVRVLFEDYYDGVLTDEKLVRGIDGIREAETLLKAEIHEVGKAQLAEVKALAKKGNLTDAEGKSVDAKKYRKAEIKRVKKEIAAAKDMKERKASAVLVIDELNKFAAEEMLKKVADAEALAEAGIAGLADTERVKKAYPDGHVVRPDESEIKALVNTEPFTKEIKKQVKLLEAENRKFKRAFRPLIEAEALVKERDAYAKYEEILARYDGALVRVQEREAAELEEIRREEEEKKAMFEQLKADRAERKNKKKKQG